MKTHRRRDVCRFSWGGLLSLCTFLYTVQPIGRSLLMISSKCCFILVKLMFRVLCIVCVCYLNTSNTFFLESISLFYLLKDQPVVIVYSTSCFFFIQWKSKGLNLFLSLCVLQSILFYVPHKVSHARKDMSLNKWHIYLWDYTFLIYLF